MVTTVLILRARVLAALLAIALCLALLAPISPAFAATPDGQQPNWMQGFDDDLDVGSILSTTYLGDRVYIGGSFTSAGGTPHANAAAIHMGDRRIDHGFMANTDGTVHSVLAATDGSGIYIGGEFTTINGVAQANFAKVDPVTGQVLSPNFGVTGPVMAMANHGSRLYIGGDFNEVLGVQRKDIAALENDAVVGGWKVNTNGKVRDLKLSADGSELYAAGTFTALDQVQAPQRVARILTATGDAQPWDVAVVNSWVVIDVALSDDETVLYIAAGGLPGQGGNRTKAIDIATGAQLWSVAHGGDPQALLVHEGLVYVGGHFQKYNGAYSNARLEAIDETTGISEPWDPILNSRFGIWELDVSPWGMLVAGDFTRIEGRSTRGITVFPQLDFGLAPPPPPPPAVDTTFPTGAFTAPLAGQAVTLPATLAGTSTDNISVATVKVTVRNRDTKDYLQADGQSVASTWAKIEPAITPGPSASWSIPLAGLPAGNYRARVKTMDTAGNETSWSANHDFVISPGVGADITAPTGSITALAGDQLAMPGSLTGIATDDTSVAEVRLTIRNRDTKDYVQSNGQSVAPGWAKLVPAIAGGPSTSWSVALAALPPGRYQARVKVIDTSLNESSWSTSYNFTVL